MKTAYFFGFLRSVAALAATSCAVLLISMPLYAEAVVSNGVATGLTIGGIAVGAAGANLLSGGGQAAVTAAGIAGQTAANLMCAVYIPTHCGCGQVDGPHGSCLPNAANTFACPLGRCHQTTNGIPVAGICDMPSHCKAVTVGGIGGGAATGVSSLGSLGQMVGQLVQTLMKGGGDSGSGSGSGSSATGNNAGCLSYYQVSTPSSDPCAYYVPSTTVATSSVDTSSQDLLNALNGNTGTSFTNPSNGSTTVGAMIASTTTTNLNGDLTSTANVTGSFTPAGATPASVAPAGLSGSIVTTDTGATFVANNVQGNTQTASFFGGDGIAGFVSTLVGGWCKSRPWSVGFIASLIPPSFFDGLCKSNGFTVGAAPLASVTSSNVTLGSNTSLTQSPPKKTVQKIIQAVASSTVLLPARVDIWAVPASVPLGARTTVFWNTENVTNCTETSPDGNFNQTSLTGGAATVPLTGPTVFTISCLDSQHNPTTNYITVRISG